MARRPNKRYCFCPERHADIDNKVMKSFKKFALQTLLDNEDGLLLPSLFGTLVIMGFTNKITNSHLRRKHRKDIRYQNAHTDGLRFKVMHRKKYRGLRKVRHTFRGAALYRLKMYRDCRERISKHIFDDNWRHYQVFTKNIDSI